jgi:hypothetical protein
MNLGWKLAATIHGKAPEGLLDSYYAERHPIGAQVLDWSRAQVGIMGPSPHARALYAIMRDLINTADGATYFAGRVWGINTRYDLGSEHPLVGRSVPDFELIDGTRIGRLMSDGQGILLDFDADESLKILANGYPCIKHISGPSNERPGLSAVLIRPDGIIAWVAENDADYTGLSKAIERWFANES